MKEKEMRGEEKFDKCKGRMGELKRSINFPLSVFVRFLQKHTRRIASD